jgi:ADP-ribose pyrophosphatase YjhB (NUDIX family)
MKKLTVLLAKIITIIGLPVSAILLHRSKRVRAVIISGDKILLVRSYIGHQRWSLPGGGIHKKETPNSAVAREVFEETGLNFKADKFTFIGEGQLSAGLPGMFAEAQFLLNRVPEQTQPTIRRPLEVIEAAWWTIGQLPNNVSPTVNQGLTMVNKHK